MPCNVKTSSGRSRSNPSHGRNHDSGQNAWKTGPNNPQTGHPEFTWKSNSDHQQDEWGSSSSHWDFFKQGSHGWQKGPDFSFSQQKAMEMADDSMINGSIAKDLQTVSPALAQSDCEDTSALLDAMISGLGLVSGPVGTAASAVGVMNSLCQNGLTLETGLDVARLGLGTIPVLGTPLKVLDGADLAAKTMGAPTTSALLADSMRSLVANKDAPGQGNAPAPKTAVSRNQTELFKHYAK